MLTDCPYNEITKKLLLFYAVTCAIIFLGMPWATLVVHASNTQSETSAMIKLPEAKVDGKVSVEAALLARRSIREYKNLPLTLEEISQLLWAAQGITGRGMLRTAPSAGALYPLELYVVAGNVAGLSAGIYKYRVQGHELVRAGEGDQRSELASAALGQSCVRNAPAVIVVSAVYARTTGKYGERGTRYVHMEAGHAAQNVALQAVALHLGTVMIGAFGDRDVKRVVQMPENEEPLYLLPVGRH
jgi:SagB-type dehydrogenase family enzyme